MSFLNPKIVVSIYMSSCVAMLVFHLMYMISDKTRGRTLSRQSRIFEKEIRKQLALIQQGKEPERKHEKRMSRRLLVLSNLKAYENAVLALKDEPKECVEKYQETIYQIFLNLVAVYRKRDEIERAYFARLIEKLGVKRRQEGKDPIICFLLDMTADKNVYVRENSFRALYALGNPQLILEAWRRQNKQEVFHNKKLLADGLLSYQGNQLELANLLWIRRKEFSERLVLPVMQFIRFSTDDFKQRFLDVMKNPQEPKELRLEAIRYFRRYPYEPAKDLLKDFLKNTQTNEWEYAAVAAQSLSGYPSPDTVTVLKLGLGSSNWHVRMNCAQTLLKGLKIPKRQLYDVYNGRDRYAKEILDYVSGTMEKSEQK